MKRTAHTPTAALILTVGALLLGGCGNDAGTAPESQTTPTATDGAAATTAAPSEAGPSEGAASGEAASMRDVARVVAAAESVVERSQALDLDWQDDGSGWDVTVVAGDTEHEIRVSPDGSDVLSQREDGQVDDEDRTELQRATVDLIQATETARGEVNGEVEDVSLDEDDGALVWEVAIREEGARDSIDVHLNAEDGSVIRTDR